MGTFAGKVIHTKENLSFRSLRATVKGKNLREVPSSHWLPHLRNQTKTELQIRGSIEDNSKIIFLISE